MRNFHRLKNSDFILESKMAEPNHNKNSKQQDWSDAVILSTKGIYQSTDLVKLDVSSQKSEILHFYCFILSKSFKDSAKKVQRSYLSWHWKVMQSLKKNWLVISSMARGICWIFTQPSKSLKISFQWALFVQKLSFMTLKTDAKFE